MIMAFASMAASFAATVAPAAELPQPGVVTIRTGMLSAELQRAHLWNLQRLRYRGVEMAAPTGAYGTVISIPAIGGWVGTGHTQGGVEVIEEVTLTVDGEDVPLEDGAAYACERAVLHKVSMLDKVRLEAEYVFENETITERVTLTATEDVTVTTVYPFMHCVTADTTEWLAITWDNQEMRGEFSGSKKLDLHEQLQWTAANLPDHETVFLLRHLTRPEDTNVLTGYWDQDRYHKLYVSMPPDGEVWEQGRSLEAHVVVTCFHASPDVWRQTACQKAMELVAE